jgi:hypothetical protein
MILSKSNNNLVFVPGIYFIYSNKNHIDKISNNSLFVSDFFYEKIINGTKFTNKIQYEPLKLYTFDLLKEKGYVQITSNKTDNLWTISNYPVKYQFIVPSKMINKDIIFTITLSPTQKFNPICNQIEFGLYNEQNQIIWTIQDTNNLNFLIPANYTINGQLEVFTKTPYIKGEKCNIHFDEVDLIPKSEFKNSNIS